MAVSVLIVEDDHNISELLQMYLEKEGYTVAAAYDGGEGLAKFRTLKPDLVLLDVMMPVMDGWSVCKAIRAESQTPIIMLTAKGETNDKVSGLKSGADDYITKPFEMKEVLARIEAVLRRSTGAAVEKKERKLTFDNLVIDMDAFVLTVKGQKIYTPPKEMELLYYLASSPNRVYTRNQLLAGTTQGVKTLMRVVAEELRTLPPVTIYEPDYVEPLPPTGTSDELEIDHLGSTWVISGVWLERLVSNINFDDYESRNYFDLQLRKCGLFTRLEEMGIQDGDTVSIYDLEFEYQR